MLFLLTAQEVVCAIHSAIRHDDGILEIDIPECRLKGKASARLILTFSEPSRTVHCGRLSARLSPMQFALLHYAYDHGRVGFEELQDAVWRKEVSDSAIRAACSALNTKLCECDFSVELTCHRGRVFLEELG